MREHDRKGVRLFRLLMDEMNIDAVDGRLELLELVQRRSCARQSNLSRQ